MATQIQYAIQTKSPVADVQTYGSLPDRLDLPSGDAVFGADAGWSNDDFQLVSREIEVPDPAPPVELTPAQKLESIGLSVADLRSILGLN